MSHHLTSIATYNEVLADFTPRSSRINFDPNAEVINEYQHTADLLVQTYGVMEVTVIFQLLNSNDNPVNWNNQHYKIFVSDTAGNEQPSDPYDYYHQVVRNPDQDWIFLRSVLLGNSSDRCTNSWTETNVLSEANLLHFRWIRFQIDEIPNHKIRMIYSAR